MHLPDCNVHVCVNHETQRAMDGWMDGYKLVEYMEYVVWWLLEIYGALSGQIN